MKRVKFSPADTFQKEDGEIPDSIGSSALNAWIFNEDTIRKVLHILMEEGIKIAYGQKIGKTIIFARNHDHAEKILKVFHKEYPHLPDDSAKVIDSRIAYAQSAIDEFSEPKKLPQIAISVDMLDTGIDVPETFYLVFFKKVMSKAKFWQMIGRGTRLCPGLFDGADKDKFYIFDFCGNFKFFRMNQGRPAANTTALQGAVFHLEFQIAYKLQALEFQTERLISYRGKLVEIMAGKVQKLDRAGICELERIREELRNLMRDIPHITVKYETGFTDDILNMEWNGAELDYDELANYREKAEYYVREHQEHDAIAS